MEKVEFKVFVSKEIAVAAGSTEYGEMTYRPTAAELAMLSPDERRCVVQIPFVNGMGLPGNRWELDAPADWPAIRRAFAKRLAAEAQERAENEAREAQREVERAAEAAAWKANDLLDVWSTRLLQERAERRPDLVHAALELLRVKVKKEREEKEAREAALAVKLAAAQACEIALKEFALTVPELREAAEENYEVTEAAASELAKRLRDSMSGRFSGSYLDRSRILKKGTVDYRDAEWSERAAPSVAALQLRRTVEAAVASVPLPTGVTATVSRVQRVKLRNAKPFTGVVVWLESPVTEDRCVIFSGDVIAAAKSHRVCDCCGAEVAS